MPFRAFRLCLVADCRYQPQYRMVNLARVREIESEIVSMNVDTSMLTINSAMSKKLLGGNVELSIAATKVAIRETRQANTKVKINRRVLNIELYRYTYQKRRDMLLLLACQNCA